MVDFNNYRIQKLVYHDVNAQNMKAHVPILIVWLGEFILMADKGLSKYDCFNNDIIYFFLHDIHIESHFLYRLKDRSQGPFVTFWHVFGTFIENELRILFVYCIICQVHTFILQVRLFWNFIRLSWKTSQSLFINIQPHWTSSTKQNINTKVKF